MGRGLSSESKDLVRRIYAVFEAEHPNSPRRVVYAIFGNKAGAMAAKVGGLCGRMLDAGDLPLDWYDDSSRAEIEPYVVEDVTAMVAMKRGTPSFDLWRSQSVRVKVWSEKSIGGTLDPVLQALSVPFLNTSGWNSRKMLMQEARATQMDPRRLIILYSVITMQAAFGCRSRIYRPALRSTARATLRSAAWPSRPRIST